jgi:hypothetical protein
MIKLTKHNISFSTILWDVLAISCSAIFDCKTHQLDSGQHPCRQLHGLPDKGLHWNYWAQSLLFLQFDLPPLLLVSSILLQRQNPKVGKSHHS